MARITWSQAVKDKTDGKLLCWIRKKKSWQDETKRNCVKGHCGSRGERSPLISWSHRKLKDFAQRLPSPFTVHTPYQLPDRVSAVPLCISSQMVFLLYPSISAPGQCFGCTPPYQLPDNASAAIYIVHRLRALGGKHKPSEKGDVYLHKTYCLLNFLCQQPNFSDVTGQWVLFSMKFH